MTTAALPVDIAAGDIIVAPTGSDDDASEIGSATGRMYPAPTGYDGGAVGFGAPGGRALRW